jgi:DNA-binding transcriptional regulator LsrR (DeoR family)
MTKNQKKQLTYEEIARKYDITTAKCHTIVRSSYNKIIRTIMENEEGVNIFQCVMALREYFNMPEAEAIEKLDDDHKEKIREWAVKEYGAKEYGINDKSV